MKTPTINYLESVETVFSVRYPEEFRLFCKKPYTASPKIIFIVDVDTLKRINTKIGEEEWGDYEHAIAHKKHPKDGNKLWGAILPFAFNDDSIFGFDYNHPGSDRVHVWSVHTVVHEYPSFEAFMRDYET